MKALKELKVKNLVMMTLAGILSAIGVTLFLEPVSLYDSGVSGTSMLLSQLTPDFLTLSIILLVLDIPLFLYGLKKQGLVFTVYSIYAVAVYSVSAWLINDVIPIDNSVSSPIAENNVLLCALFGGMICGAGSGLSVRFGGAIDGIEVLAVIFAKKIGLTVGTFMMCYNVILYIICGCILKSWILPLYSIVTYVAALKTIDFIVDGFDRAKAAIIITEQGEAVGKGLSEAFKTGMTQLNAKGVYSGHQKTMLYFVINRFQVVKLKETVHTIDPQAYITITEIADVFSLNQDKE